MISEGTTAEGAENAEPGMEDRALTQAIIGAAIEVHKALGPGLLESAYEACLAAELNALGIPFKRQVPLPIRYRDEQLDCGYRLDLVVYNRVVIELKSVDQISPIHRAQLLSYLRLSGHPIGLLINFNVTRLTDGVTRLVQDYAKP